MYFCKHCHEVFDSGISYNEPSEAWGHIVYEESLLCPYCGAPIREVEIAPCLECNNFKKCVIYYIKEEEPMCEIGCDYIDIFEEQKEYYE